MVLSLPGSDAVKMAASYVSCVPEGVGGLGFRV